MIHLQVTLVVGHVCFSVCHANGLRLCQFTSMAIYMKFTRVYIEQFGNLSMMKALFRPFRNCSAPDCSSQKRLWTSKIKAESKESVGAQKVEKCAYRLIDTHISMHGSLSQEQSIPFKCHSLGGIHYCDIFTRRIDATSHRADREKK